MSQDPVLLWLREDLRFDDHPAMRDAADSGAPVICLYVLDEESAGDHAMGGAQKWWLHHSLTAFRHDLDTRGGALILRRGEARHIIPKVAKEIGAQTIYWTRRYMPWQVEQDKALKEALTKSGHKVESHNGRLLHEPWEVETKTGNPYRVFTPYWKQVQVMDTVRPPLPRVDKLEAPSCLPKSDRLEDWDLLPTRPNWATGFEPIWTPGEKGARARWRDWLGKHATGYKEQRNRPDLDATTRLSPHLHFGEISPNTLWHDMRDIMDASKVPMNDGKHFLSEVVWREFSYQLIYHNPTMFIEPLMEKFADFQWNDDPSAFEAWQKGLTGYPIVDAGMRQLWQEGWMHNRVRMIVGSFLIKDLFIHWRQGMAWFWDTLLDADPANNTASWQWIAGCGADAAPYFRIFNPTTQGEKFDPDGEYIRKYVPELALLPTKCIHEPHKAPPLVLREADVVLGKTYPEPIVDHGTQRQEALARYEAIKG